MFSFKLVNKDVGIFRGKYFQFAYFSVTDRSQKSIKKSKNIIQNPSKEDLKWRTPMSQQPGEFVSKLKVFAPEEEKKTSRAQTLRFLQSDIDLRPSTIKKWFLRKHEEMIEDDQKFNPARLEALGSELAAAHFIVHRGGSVKFMNNPNWIKKNKNDEYNLPSNYDSNYVIEAIDCKGSPLTYGGLENMKQLSSIKSFSVNTCEKMDDWCVDRIAGQYMETLETLDLRNCPYITSRGLQAIYKLKKLKLLQVDRTDSKEFEMVCLLLNELMPQLNIELNESPLPSATNKQ